MTNVSNNLQIDMESTTRQTNVKVMWAPFVLPTVPEQKCSGCGMLMTAKILSRNISRLDYDDVLEIRMPIVRCPGCGKDAEWEMRYVQ